MADREIATIRSTDLAAFRRDLKASGAGLDKEFRKAERDIARTVAAEARKFARGTGPMQAHFAGSIYGTAGRDGAAIAIKREANAAFWGAEKHTGWYDDWRFSDSTGRQFLPWVGNHWDVGKLGQGPYAINPAIFHEDRNIERLYLEAVERAARPAFPDGATATNGNTTITGIQGYD